MPIVVVNRFGRDELSSAVVLTVALFSLSFVPLVVLHIKYWLLNRKQSIEFRSKSIVICDGEGAVEYQYKQIDKVVSVVPKASRNIPWFPWQLYGYAYFYFDKDEKVITSLLVPHVFNMEFPARVEKLSLFCYPRNTR